jgi:predicted DNA-binding transcriptional regulator AlpA
MTASELMNRWRMGRTTFYAKIQTGEVPKPEVIGGKKLWSVDRIEAIEQKARRQAER